jgi:hypothetical protein
MCTDGDVYHDAIKTKYVDGGGYTNENVVGVYVDLIFRKLFFRIDKTFLPIAYDLNVSEDTVFVPAAASGRFKFGSIKVINE